MKKTIMKILVFVGAGITAFVILNLFCVLFYCLPRHLEVKSGATDYKWDSDFFYSRGTEGFAYGVTNNEGYNNLFDYTGQEVNNLMMGSSHMEGFNVAQSENAAAIINAEISDKVTYNIGTSDHDFYVVCDNLDAALAFYNPTDYVFIETMNVMLDKEKLQNLNDDKYPEIAVHGGILSQLQRMPFARLIYRQLSNMSVSNAAPSNYVYISPDAEYIEELEETISNIKRICDKHNVTPIIFRQVEFSINPDGSVAEEATYEYVEKFAEICEKKGVRFIDMVEAYIAHYNKTKEFSHGFCNTAAGEGHINKVGQRIVAEELIKAMNEDG